MSQGSTFPGHRTKKTLADASYRPFIELSNEMTRYLVATNAIEPIVIADVGARGSFDPIWDVFEHHRIEIGFEPDPVECARLNSICTGAGPRRMFVPAALSSSTGLATLHITQDPSASSLYRPNAAYFERFPQSDPHRVVKEVPVQTRRLDDCCLPIPHSGIDVMKMDVQGGELEVLTGGAQCVREDVICVISEAMFDQQYEGQPVFAEVDGFLRPAGFLLVDIDMRRWRRRALPSQFDHLRMGFSAYADVLYFRDPIFKPATFVRSAHRRSKLLKLAAVSEIFSQIDFAMELLDLLHAEDLIGTDFRATALVKLGENRIVQYNDRSRMPAVI